MGFFLVGNLALSVFAFSFFVFVQCGERKSLAHRILVGNQRERTTLGHGFLSFFVYLVTILYCSDIVWSKDLSGCFLCFLPILDRKFSLFFLLSPTLWLGIFFLFCFLPFFDWEFYFFVFFWGQGLRFSPWVKAHGKLGFWLKACRMARHDIC